MPTTTTTARGRGRGEGRGGGGGRGGRGGGRGTPTTPGETMAYVNAATQTPLSLNTWPTSTQPRKKEEEKKARLLIPKQLFYSFAGKTTETRNQQGTMVIAPPVTRHDGNRKLPSTRHDGSAHIVHTLDYEDLHTKTRRIFFVAITSQRSSFSHSRRCSMFARSTTRRQG